MKRYFDPAIILITGLFFSQLIFTVLVFLSDVSLFNQLTAIKHAGFLIVPNENVMLTLHQVKPAFFGALFFTLTTGAGLTLTTFWMIFGWHRIFNKNRFIFICILIFWGFILFKLNHNGMNLPVSMAFIIVPVIVGTITKKRFSDAKKLSNPLNILIHIVVLIIIGITWAPKINADVFITIRDHLLLTHSLGKKINTFYYNYTLYPAEAFKSFDQKLLKTCHIKINNNKLFQKVNARLARQDYLSVDKRFPVDLTLIQQNSLLLFKHNETLIYECAIDDFLADPDHHLKLYSKKCDKNIFFRQATFISMLVCSPLICYLFIHAISMLILFFIRLPALRSTCASVACLIIGVAIVFPLYQIQESFESKTKPEIFKTLESSNWEERVIALKNLSDKKISIDQSNSLSEMIKSPFIPERYWMAKALSNSDSPESLKMVIDLLDDPHPNVVCMALYSLGKKNKSIATPKIIELIKSSKHWYVQWYAYKSLKRLGWTQSK